MRGGTYRSLKKTCIKALCVWLDKFSNREIFYVNIENFMRRKFVENLLVDQ